ncbi:hypothetical protein GWI33_015254 [Rhynchophorus ferrugineus]|uniref:Ionotropic receptor n=1 Tax=Rhynchophorus ferrugineus TaxID=354439 RepID=A0A834I3N1_RHYFE|nr:hypothetical protein GWI33_015254 [Rhynchophorus ferrugineus]
MSMIIAILLFFVSKSTNSILVDHSLNLMVEKELNRLVVSQFSSKEHVENLGIILNNSSYLKDIINMILLNPNFKSPYRTINYLEQKKPILRVQFTDIVILTEKVTEIVSLVHYFRDNPFIWSASTRFYFVITTDSIRPHDMIVDMLREIWITAGIINFALVFLDGRDKNVLTLNPFIDTMHMYTIEDSRNSIFARKTANLHRYKLKIGLFNIFPILSMTDTTCSGSLGCVIMEIFLKKINASTLFIHPKELRGVTELIRKNEADMIFNEIFVLVPSILWYVPYPLQITEIVALTRSANSVPFILKLFYIFDLIVWIMLAILTIKLLLFKYVFGILEIDKFKEKNPVGYKIIVLTGSLCFLFFSNTFNGGIIRAVVAPKYYQNLDTVDDLVQSGLSLYGEPEWRFFINEMLLKQYVNVSYKVVGDRLKMCNTTDVYAVTTEYAKSILNNRNYPKVKMYYHEVKEIIGSSFLALFTRINSPFKESLKDIILRVASYGINNRFGTVPITLVSPKTEATTLSLVHLEAAFLILLIGLVISTLTLIIEIVIHKRGKKIKHT